MRVEGNALLCYLAKLGKRKYLEAARVGEDGTVPIEELMQSSHTADKLISRSYMKVVGVGKLYLAVYLL